MRLGCSSTTGGRTWYRGLVSTMSAGLRRCLSEYCCEGRTIRKLRDSHNAPEGESHSDPLAVNMPMHEANEAERMPLLASAVPALEHVTNALSDSDAARIAALHNSHSRLAHLATVLAEEQERQEKALNKFTVDESLERIQKLSAEQRNEFDVLDFVGELRFGSGRALWGSEEFHSDVLAWLLTPRHSHGLGDRFLTRFLEQAGMPSVGSPQDWAATEVIREWAHVVDGREGRLDILIVNHTQQMLCAIENKVFSDEHSNQLTRYRKALEISSYSAFTKYLVFLTPWGIFPACEEEKRQWKSLAYSKVFGIVQHIVNNHEIPTHAGVREFLNQYATTLRRNIMPETSLSQLARKTYLEHREAIDLILANKPDWVSEARQWLKEGNRSATGVVAGPGR